MTASATQVSLAKQALLQIGARNTLVSFQDGTVEATACSVLYTPKFELLARTARWNCLKKQATLSLLMAAQGTPENPSGTSYTQPPTPWLYAYALPSDCLAMRFIVPSYPNLGVTTPLTTASYVANTAISPQMQIPFDVAYSVDRNNNPIQIILTNQTQAQAVYTVNQPNPVIWDSMFQEAFVQTLAAFLVPALAMNGALLQAAAAAADKLILQARVADGNEGVTVADHIPDWIRARNQGSGTFVNWNNNQYVDIVWPTYG